MSDPRPDTIRVYGAAQNNLKNVSVEIPKKQITVFTGISGSGKSSLCLDTIAAESRRELNETFPSFVQQYLPKYGRPSVERIENLPVTILIDQKKPGLNSRSTVGTYTDIYALLRLLFSRVGKPFVGYSDTFSFNHPSGQCPRCEGLGEVTELDIHKLVDFDKCLNDEDVIHFPTFTTGAWRWKRYAYSGLFDLNKKIRDYSPEELDLFLNSPQIRLKNPPSNWPKSAKFEGLYPRMYRSIITTKEGKRQQKVLDRMVSQFTCPQCGGARVNERVLSCRILGKNIAEVCDLTIPEAYEWARSIEDPLASDMVRELTRRLSALMEIGLGYLSLSRGTSTLSGGEAQRIKIAKYIYSALTDIVYVLDEPSVGLHPQDIERLKKSLLRLRDHGNTILIVEHHKEIIALADHVVDLGPGAGDHGGKITFEGTFEGLVQSGTTTGKMLRRSSGFAMHRRSPSGFFSLKDACYHNLKHVSVDIPLGALTVICGVAGSGKSSLVDAFLKEYSSEELPAVFIGQRDIGISLRSTPATYLDISDPIRNRFARANGVSNQWFSFNSKGACPACGGRGVISSDMAYMETIETVCELCGGKRYNEEALSYRYGGKNIAEIMEMTVAEACRFFAGEDFLPRLVAMERVGLGYLHLNQAMSTLSGGELQRVKLAGELWQEDASPRLFVLDEPTNGLHLDDIRRLLLLFQEMVDAGHTLILTEHSPEVMHEADWLIELGPGAGDAGGELLFSGPAEDILSCEASVTRPYLA